MVLMSGVLLCYISFWNSFLTCKVITLPGFSPLMILIYISIVLVSYPYLNEKRSLKPFCHELRQILTVKGKPLYAFQSGETERAMVPFYTGHYLTPIQSLDEMRSLGISKDKLVLVVDDRKSRPLYHSLKDRFPDVLVSGQSGKRHMALLTNKGK
ncbi:MAG: hypothetical protein SCALA701_23150 [Candidatus Scalindua sp.]|nr:MAG: hypothetical protein SCALA701_23150 [Candidatus Scalindua sp.]